ncbi:hypothetical protein ABTK28_22425, partial [Acinetobacter baumannii]
DQQCYEGRKNLNLPQFLKHNRKLLEMLLQNMDKQSILQYQTEERTMMTFRLVSARYRVKELLDIMEGDAISFPNKIE